jgi:hypothetical protein
MKTARPVFLAVALITLFTTWGFQAHAFRCGTELVRLGDSASDVRDKCGEPTDVEVWYESIPGWKLGPYDMEPYRDSGFPSYRYELWTYNLGSSQFIRYLEFKDGRLVKITRGDYGY